MAKGHSTYFSRMISSTVSLGLLTTASMVIGLISTVVVARGFTAEDFGTFVLLQVVVGFLSQVSGLGLNMAIPRFLAGTEDEVRKQTLVSTAILLRFSAIVFVSLVAWVGRPLLLKIFSASILTDLMIFVPLLFLLESTLNLLKSILQGLFLFSRMGITDLITGSLNLLLLLTAVSFLKSGVVGLILVRTIAVFVAGAFAYFSIPLKKKLVMHPDIIKEVVKFGFPLQLNEIMHFIYTRIDTLAIGVLLGSAEIATYEIARKIPDSLARLYEPFRAVYFVFSSQLYALENKNKAARLLNDSARLVAFATAFGAAVALLFGKDIIQLTFSAKYLASAPLFVLLMVNLSASLVGNVLGTSLVAVGEPDKPAIVNIFNMIVSFLGCMLFTPIWGITGAAIGNLLGTASVYPPMMFFLRKKIDAKVIPYLKPIVILCVWAALLLLLKPISLMVKSGSIVVFLFACMLLSVVTKNDLKLLLSETGLSKWGPIRKFFAPGGGE